MNVRSSDLASASGDRLYPTFIAICGSYGGSVSDVHENTELTSSLELARFGSSFFSGEVTLRGAETTLSQRLVTAFVERVDPERNDLRKSAPDPGISCSAEEVSSPPDLLLLSRSVRKQTLASYEIEGHTIPIRDTNPVFEIRYEPSPYFDFNGAHLLYFATYPTISDRAERAFLNQSGGKDWALRSSTRARHTFYLANLDLGDSVRVQVRHSRPVAGGHLLHTTLLRDHDDQRMAEIFTLKAVR
jgi:probable biosynthetic protein (TIGR04098 family)